MKDGKRGAKWYSCEDVAHRPLAATQEGNELLEYNSGINKSGHVARIARVT